MKRFTETNKWRDPWYRKLSSPAKQLWEYLRDNCDAIGLIDVDFTLVTIDCGQAVDEAHASELGDRVQALGGNRYFLPKFIAFQYGTLSESCPAHKSVISMIRTHGLRRDGLRYAYPTPTLPLPTRQDRTGMERNGQEEGVQGEEPVHTVTGDPLPTISQALQWLENWRKNGADYADAELRSSFLALSASGWMWGRNPIRDYRAALERQIQTDRDRKRQPERTESKQIQEHIDVKSV